MAELAKGEGLESPFQPHTNKQLNYNVIAVITHECSMSHLIDPKTCSI